MEGQTCTFKSEVEVPDRGRGAPHEEPPVQTDADSEHALPLPAPHPPHRNAPPEQTARTLGPPQLSPPFNLQIRLHF